MKSRLYLLLIVIAALCAVGWSGYAQGQRSAARQAWEYKTIMLSRTAGQDWSAWSEDANKLPLPVNGTAKRAELGSQDWELVAVSTVEESAMDARGVPSTYTSNQIQYYKRPK